MHTEIKQDQGVRSAQAGFESPQPRQHEFETAGAEAIGVSILAASLPRPVEKGLGDHGPYHCAQRAGLSREVADREGGMREAVHG